MKKMMRQVMKKKTERTALRTKCFWLASMILLLCMMLAGCGKEEKIKYSGELEGLHWTIDANGKLTVTGAMETGLPEWGFYESEGNRSWSWGNAPWSSYKGEITSAVMSFSGAESLYGLLANFPQLKEADLTGMDTSKVRNMDVMFCKSARLETVALNGCNLENTESMNNAFLGCTSLTKIDFTDTRTSGSLTDLFGMFQGCSNLTSVDLSSFDTSGNPRTAAMFLGCSSMKEILVREDWSTDADTALMFDGCGIDHVTVKQ